VKKAGPRAATTADKMVAWRADLKDLQTAATMVEGSAVLMVGNLVAHWVVTSVWSSVDRWAGQTDVHWAGWKAVLMAETRVASWAVMWAAPKAGCWVRCSAVAWAWKTVDCWVENLVVLLAVCSVVWTAARTAVRSAVNSAAWRVVKWELLEVEHLVDLTVRRSADLWDEPPAEPKAACWAAMKADRSA